MTDQSKELQQQIETAFENKTACRIVGADSKYFLGNASEGEIVSTKNHTGVISYDASELVITVRSGTSLKEINNILSENNQSLAFEPPAFSNDATIGGTIACNLSGPARPYTGAARDFVLGTRIINGKGEDCRFGGQVMKNVAGYDASRLMAGAYGTLGVILDVSLKVLPVAQTETTIKIEQPVNTAIQTINKLSAKNLPISASCYFDNHLYIRLNSSEQNTRAVSKNICQQITGSEISNSKEFWHNIREQEHDFFKTEKSIARISLPSTCQDLQFDGDFSGEQLIEWGGALRWLKSDLDIDQIRDAVKELGGHVTAYKNFTAETEFFQPLDAGLKTLHQRLKQGFDPAGILNPHRLYKEL